jgi:DNA topoisomerase-1
LTTLVIVESPAKAKTIAGYLGPEFVVESSIGHIRDLPSGKDVPDAIKGHHWSNMAVDVDHGFIAHYVVSDRSKPQVTKLKALLKQADRLLLATDEDREGEAISWHLLEVLKPKVPVERMVFHEITRDAIQRAVQTTRDLDMDLVRAQETRRILDRLYGFEVSPVLWRRVAPGTSAGRVQSPATRMVVARERDRMAFVAADWWDLDADAQARREQTSGAPTGLRARLVGVDGRRMATGRDFDATGTLVRDTVVLDETRARTLAEGLRGGELTVTAVETKPYKRSPAAPFMTSTLQQEAGRKLRFSSQRTMSVAQSLYQNGYITYMRTDSTSLSETAIAAARDAARALYGEGSIPASPRAYNRKVKNAQEAHEAIRPSGDVFRTPGSLARELDGDEVRLYELIWQRTVASQMIDATGTSAVIRLAGSSAGSALELQANGKVITEPGFLRAYVEGSDDPDAELEEADRRLPEVSIGDVLDVTDVEADGHTTQPPARYTEASLVKAMEELGIGRPSTYAATIATVIDRGYVWKKGSALVPSWLAFAVIGLLEDHFGPLVDYGFTAALEDDLDRIAGGQEQWDEWLARFYFGESGLQQLASDKLEQIDARAVNSIPMGATPEGLPLVLRVGRYGPYIQEGPDGGRKASVPEDVAPDELTVQRIIELLEQPSGDRELGVHPQTGLAVTAKAGRYGPYVTEALPENAKKSAKPRTSSLFTTMSLDTLSLEQAVELLTIPRTLGELGGEEVTAHNGKFGPYVKKGTDSRSLAGEEQILTVTLAEAEALFATPKERRGRGAAKPPLAEVGTDPVSGRPMVVKEGRFGPYVTDGETNASLRKGDQPESLTVERAAELLADRRARGPAVKKAAPRKAAAKKAPAKKVAAKKAPAKKAS